MFFNQQNDRMIVYLEFQRIFIYKYVGSSEFSSNQSQTGNSQWELIRQVTDYPYFFDNPKTTGRIEPFT